MEDFSNRTYGTSGLDNRPLFGETSAKDRIINLVVGSLTSLLILVTLISAFVFPQLPPKPLNIFFAVCISLSSITACILIYWYRPRRLRTKFRKPNLLYLFSIIMLCICANLYSMMWERQATLLPFPFSFTSKC
uniref:Transmembrane protein 243 n=1 Tax=Balaenoptera musculus TaxID=9771 RepID=A0A8C0HX97_BALMU